MVTRESDLADLQFLRVGDHDLALPSYATTGSAGLDLCAARGHRIDPGERKLVGTGFAIALPSNCEGQIRPRSGLAARSGLTVLNAPGTIDADYRGEVKVLLINLGLEPVEILPGDRIAQLVVAPVSRLRLIEVDDLPSTVRDAGGFGSTGR
ncbi:MAG TPA: dUTP diphosphatase [Gemmatimonadota bacterium]|nr:dUTP diphosphatase [Gemmatimonadota bacterium]